MVGFRLRVVLAAAVAGAAMFCVAGAASAPRADSAATAGATQIPSVPATVEGKTNGATVSKSEPAPSCTTARGIVWYEVRAPRRGAMAATLQAGGKLNGAIAVVREARSQKHEIVCAETDAQGRAVAAWQAYVDGSYVIGIVRGSQSPNGTFRLTIVPAEPPPAPPGQPLPADGVQMTANPVLDTADAWSVPMERGTSYRINLTTPGHCLALEIYRPGTYSFSLARPVKSSSCGGYVVFTPGLDGGGLYSLVVRAEGTTPNDYPYHLQSAAYELDDGAPGIELASGQWAKGSLDGNGIDLIDLYHFTVPRRNQLTRIDLEQKPSIGFDLMVLHEDGGRVACACDTTGRQVIRQTLAPGRYFVAVRSQHKAAGDYRSGRGASSPVPGVVVHDVDLAARAALALAAQHLQVPRYFDRARDRRRDSRPGPRSARPRSSGRRRRPAARRRRATAGTAAPPRPGRRRAARRMRSVMSPSYEVSPNIERKRRVGHEQRRRGRRRTAAWSRRSGHPRARRARPRGARRARCTASSARTAPASRRRSGSCSGCSASDAGTVAAVRRRPVARRGRPPPAPRLRARRREPVAEPVAAARSIDLLLRMRGATRRRPAPRRAARAVRARPDQEGPRLLQGQPAEGRPGRGVRGADATCWSSTSRPPGWTR